jgi:quercetin dioxygenase-like cupin family protein
MRYNYPHTIDNGSGEQLTFVRLVKDETGDYLEVENTVQPNAGPPMHVHHLQEETITVIKGRIATQIQGEEPKVYGAGNTVSFKAGVVHKFWNPGPEPMVGKGFIKPAHNIEYFLTEIFASTKANGGKRPGNFDAAYLIDKYKTEFDMTEVPLFVKKVVFPVVRFVGKLQGKHKKFAGAPEAVKKV